MLAPDARRSLAGTNVATKLPHCQRYGGPTKVFTQS